MSFCTKCGKQNPNTSKFCTGCGNALAITPSATSSANEVSNAVYNEWPETDKAKSKTTIWLLAAILLLGTATASYFIFFNKKNDNKNSAATEATTSEPTAEQIQNESAKLNQIRNEYEQEGSKKQEAVSLENTAGETTTTISEAEKNAVSQMLRNFYECENTEDIDCLMKNYAFPINRYYQLNNTSYEKLHSMIVDAFSNKLAHHFIAINWDYSTVEKVPGGFKAQLSANYELSRPESPEAYTNKNIQIFVFMNNAYRITSIYESK